MASMISIVVWFYGKSIALYYVQSGGLYSFTTSLQHPTLNIKKTIAARDARREKCMLWHCKVPFHRDLLFLAPLDNVSHSLSHLEKKTTNY